MFRDVEKKGRVECGWRSIHPSTTAGSERGSTVREDSVGGGFSQENPIPHIYSGFIVFVTMQEEGEA